MQTILGTGGAIGKELAKALLKYTNKIRVASPNPEKVNSTDEVMPADLLNPNEIRKAVENSSVVYVMMGLPCNANMWNEGWHILMENVLIACKEHDCKLVFFDNMDMYDKNHLNGMTEDTPVNPPSTKGKVRARVAKLIMDKANKGELRALIARSADFYGPKIKGVSMLTEMVINPLSEGKKANWIGSTTVRHSFTYTPDAGKATAMLGNTDDAYNQIWHLPTAANPWTGRQWIQAVARELGVQAKYREISKLILQFIGLFVPVMGELIEMFYQYNRDYVFDSSKFEQRFGFIPTPYTEGIKQTIKAEIGTCETVS